MKASGQRAIAARRSSPQREKSSAPARCSTVSPAASHIFGMRSGIPPSPSMRVSCAGQCRVRASRSTQWGHRGAKLSQHTRAQARKILPLLQDCRNPQRVGNSRPLTASTSSTGPCSRASPLRHILPSSLEVHSVISTSTQMADRASLSVVPWRLQVIR
jgi:hypothetical protein